MCLGNIRAVELWIDNRGTKPHWNCEKIIVRDYQTMTEWVFMAQLWFSLIKDDCSVHRILYQKSLKTLTNRQKIFSLEDFYTTHLWMGMMVR